jgi:CRISPR/Cas system-associated endonuclease/helicase Cas3
MYITYQVKSSQMSSLSLTACVFVFCTTNVMKLSLETNVFDTNKQMKQSNTVLDEIQTLFSQL